jgi:sporulation protein YlmC with PRC-barrel domain
MAQERTAPTPLIESDRVEGMAVYSGEGTQIGTIKRLIIDRASGRVVYVVIAFVASFGLEGVPYVIPWARLAYDENDGGYHSDITETELRSAPAAARGEVDWSDRESLEALEGYFRIPPGWRSI